MWTSLAVCTESSCLQFQATSDGERERSIKFKVFNEHDNGTRSLFSRITLDRVPGKRAGDKIEMVGSRGLFDHDAEGKRAPVRSVAE